MRRFLYILSALAGLLSCSGYVDYEDPNNVPEGVLRVFADKTSIKADGTETVTFTSHLLYILSVKVMNSSDLLISLI